MDYIHYCIITPFKKKTFHIKPSLLNVWNEITQSGLFFSLMFLGNIKLDIYFTFQHFNQHLRMRDIICKTNSSSVNLNLHCLNFHLGQFALALGRLLNITDWWKCSTCYYYSCVVLSLIGGLWALGQSWMPGSHTLAQIEETKGRQRNLITRSMCVCQRKGSRRIYADLVLLPCLPSVQIWVLNTKTWRY